MLKTKIIKRPSHNPIIVLSAHHSLRPHIMAISVERSNIFFFATHHSDGRDSLRDVTLLLIARKQRKLHLRRFICTRKWILRHLLYGQYKKRMHELIREDPASFRNLVCLDVTTFREMVDRITAKVVRQDSVWRRSILFSPRSCAECTRHYSSVLLTYSCPTLLYYSLLLSVVCSLSRPLCGTSRTSRFLSTHAHSVVLWLARLYSFGCAFCLVLWAEFPQTCTESHRIGRRYSAAIRHRS